MAKQHHDKPTTQSPRYYEDAFDYRGEVRLVDLEARTFALRLFDTTFIRAPFKAEDEEFLIEALNKHTSHFLRIEGMARYALPTGELEEVLHVDSYKVVPNEAPEDEKPVWQKIIEFGETIPDEVLAQLPTDLARNFDHYVYGD